MRATAGERRDAGFTLVEVMISILLTAIAIIGIVALYMSETRASGFSRHSTEAATLAEDKLEALFRLAPANGSDAGTLNEQGVAGGIYTRFWSATAVSSYWDLVVTVQWVEDDPAKPKQVVLYGRRNQ